MFLSRPVIFTRPSGRNAQVARVEPAVAQHFRGRFRVAVVAEHHVRPAHGDLTVALGVRRVDLHLDADERPAHAARVRALRAVEAGDRRGLREAVALDHAPAEVGVAPEHFGGERRGAAREDADLAEPGLLADRLEQLLADAQARRHAHEARDVQKSDFTSSLRGAAGPRCPLDRRQGASRRAAARRRRSSRRTNACPRAAASSRARA